MFAKIVSFIEKNVIYTYLLIAVIFGFLTYFINYNIPNNSIWDEVYHISSAQKYIDNVHFMEAHPPLAKLLIASGEILINPNDSYENLNPVARLCLQNTPATYNYTEDGVDKKKTSVDNGKGGTRKINLLDVREIIGSKIDKTSFTEVDSIKEYPEYFSFCGYRFMPVLMASFLPALFFILIYQLTKNPHLSIFAASFIAFDNALVVHFRSAMLDSIQMFFILSALIFTVISINKILEKKSAGVLNYLLIGVFVSFSIATKHNGLIFLILPVITAFVELIIKSKDNQKKYIDNFSDKVRLFITKNYKTAISLLAKLGIVFSVIYLIYAAIFFVHIYLGQNILETNENKNGKYRATSEYIEAIESMDFLDPRLYITGFEDNLEFMGQYHEGVPKLNLTSETENGSYPSNWPVMNRTISYRWDTSDGENYKYIYLIGNPFIWFAAIASVIISIIVIVGKYIYKVEIENKKSFYFLIMFISLYLLYMLAMLYIIRVRVMYLYHYLIPLVISLASIPLLYDIFFDKILRDQDLEIYPGNKPFYVYSSMLIIVSLVIFGFIFFSPFTYHLPLNSDQFDMRNWFDFWLMRKANS